MLLAAHDATRLGLYQVLLLEATGRVLGRAMEYLRLAADRLCIRHVYRIVRNKGPNSQTRIGPPYKKN